MKRSTMGDNRIGGQIVLRIDVPARMAVPNALSRLTDGRYRSALLQRGAHSFGRSQMSEKILDQ